MRYQVIKSLVIYIFFAALISSWKGIRLHLVLCQTYPVCGFRVREIFSGWVLFDLGLNIFGKVMKFGFGFEVYLLLSGWIGLKFGNFVVVWKFGRFKNSVLVLSEFNSHKDFDLKLPPWLSFRLPLLFLIYNSMLWSKCLDSFVWKHKKSIKFWRTIFL